MAGGADLARLVCAAAAPVGPDDVHALERAATVLVAVCVPSASCHALIS